MTLAIPARRLLLTPRQGALVPPDGRVFVTETISGVVYYLTETILGVTYYLTEAA